MAAFYLVHFWTSWQRAGLQRWLLERCLRAWRKASSHLPSGKLTAVHAWDCLQGAGGRHDCMSPSGMFIPASAGTNAACVCACVMCRAKTIKSMVDKITSNPGEFDKMSAVKDKVSQACSFHSHAAGRPVKRQDIAVSLWLATDYGMLLVLHIAQVTAAKSIMMTNMQSMIARDDQLRNMEDKSNTLLGAVRPAVRGAAFWVTCRSWPRHHPNANCLSAVVHYLPTTLRPPVIGERVSVSGQEDSHPHVVEQLQDEDHHRGSSAAAGFGPVPRHLLRRRALLQWWLQPVTQPQPITREPTYAWPAQPTWAMSWSRCREVYSHAKSGSRLWFVICSVRCIREGLTTSCFLRQLFASLLQR